MTGRDITRQGRHGEARFSELCQSPSALVDAVVNKAADDEHGWDHVIDLTPPQSLKMPADLKDHLIQCFAQIKTTSRKQPKTRVKLSNAIKAVKSPNPTFVFLFHHQAEGEVPTLYGKHFWRGDIERILRRAREISVKDPEKALHQVHLTLAFSDEDRIKKHPSDWMFDVVQEHGGGTYSKEKLKLVETVGYGEFTHNGKFSIPSPASAEDIVLHELGLLEDLPIVDLQIFDQRFGLEIEVLESSFKEGRISISREEKPITLKLVSEEERTFEIPATGRIPRLIPPNNPEFRMRVDAGCIDIVAAPNQKNQQINLSLELDELGTFRQKIGLMCILAWGHNGKLRFEAHMEQGKLFGGEMDQVPMTADWMQQHADVGVHLAELLGPEKTDKIRISHTSFQRCVHDMHLASALASAGSFRFEAEFDSEIDPFDHLIGYACTVVEDWCVGAIYQIEHKARDSEGSRQMFYFSHPKVVQKFAFKQPFEQFQRYVASEFEGFRSRLEGPTAVMMGGDISEWSKAINTHGAISVDVE